MLPGQSSILDVFKYNYIYFPMAKFKFDILQLVIFKYSLTNVNFKTLIYFAIPMLLPHIFQHFCFVTLCIVNLQVFCHKSRQAYGILSIYAAYKSHICWLLFVSLQWHIKCVFDLYLNQIHQIYYSNTNRICYSVMVKCKYELHCISNT